MEPLSSRKRKTYLGILIVVFFCVLPITILYSAGYRLGDHFTIVKTGGIYLGLNESGASLYLDGEFVRSAGILKKGFFIQDLKPGTYDIRVEKDGFHTWEKTLQVFPQRVVEASSFIFPNELSFEEIAEYLNMSTTTPITKKIQNETYVSALELFATTTTPTTLEPFELVALGVGTTSRMSSYRLIKKKGDIVLWQESGDLYASWVGDPSSAPLYFCDTLGVCSRKILLSQDPLRQADFYTNGNEFVILAVPNGIIVREIDDRSTRNSTFLYHGAGSDFRIIGDELFVKDGKRIVKAQL
jgi:hypothetical protein